MEIASIVRDGESRRDKIGEEGRDGTRRAHLDPIFHFDFAAGVHGDVLESLARAIVGFATTLKGLQHCGLVHAPRDVGVKSAGAARGGTEESFITQPGTHGESWGRT
jgi:hypothetical protein